VSGFFVVFAFIVVYYSYVYYYHLFSMTTPLYRDAVRHGWRLAREHMWLWPLGMFAALLGQMGLLELLTKVGLAASDYGVYPHWLALPKLFGAIGDVGPFHINVSGVVWMVWLTIALIGLCLFFLFVSVVSQGALIHIAAISSGKKNLPSIGPSWHASVGHFWRLLAIHAIKKGVFVLLTVAVGWATLNMMQDITGMDFVLFLLVFLLASTVGVILSFLVIYMSGYAVVEEYSLWQAMQAGWRLFTDHWLVSFEVGVIILGLNVVVGLMGLFAVMLFFFPSIFLWVVALFTGNTLIYGIGLIVGITLSIISVILIGSVFSVFTIATWTYLFTKMYIHGIASRLLGWTRR